MKPNEVLSKKLQVKPLEEREIARYILINSGKRGNQFDLEGKPIPTQKPAYSYPGKSYVYDHGSKKKVLIGNVTGEDIKQDEMSGKQYSTHKIESVTFINGVLTITHEDNALYQYIERVDNNESNPYRDKKKKAIFRKVNALAEKEQERVEYELEDDAIFMIKDMTDDQVKKLCLNLPEETLKSLNLDMPISDIKFALRQLVKKGMYKEIIKASRDNAKVLKLHIIDAENYNVLTRNGRDWFVRSDNREPILTVEVGKNMIDELITHILKTDKGKKVYEKFIEELKELKKR